MLGYMVDCQLVTNVTLVTSDRCQWRDVPLCTTCSICSEGHISLFHSDRRDRVGPPLGGPTDQNRVVGQVKFVSAVCVPWNTEHAAVTYTERSTGQTFVSDHRTSSLTITRYSVLRTTAQLVYGIK